MENSKEIWKDVIGFEGYYQVSSLGEVRSLDRHVNGNCGSVYVSKGRILKQIEDKLGYQRVNLCKDGEQIMFLVHRLVYEAFNGKIPEGMQVNHIDEDKSNNRLENLNLMTPKENTNWGTAIERRSKPVIQYSLTGEKLAEYPSQREAERITSIMQVLISLCCRGKRKTAGGFIFKYKK